ncbi:MAG: hypothetical protein FWJ61_02750, partial [Limnochordales bacterium]
EGQSSIVCRDTERLAGLLEGAGGAGAPDAVDPESFGRLGYEGLPPKPGFVKVARTWTEEEILTVTLPHPSLLR